MRCPASCSGALRWWTRVPPSGLRAGRSPSTRSPVTCPVRVNYPFSKALDSNGFMRESGELRGELEPFTERPGGLIAMCGSGVTACHLLLALHSAGLGDGRTYIGSWSEWIRDPRRAVAGGDAPAA